jgi:hypothetical protein
MHAQVILPSMNRMDKIQYWGYHSADLFLPYSVQKILGQYYVGSDTSTFYLTNWSVLHFLSGIATAYFLQSRTTQIYLTSFLIHTMWELWQIFVKKTPIRTRRGQIDTVVDTVLFMLGVAAYQEYLRLSK